MKMNFKIGFLSIAALLFTACNVPNQASEGNSNEVANHFGDGVDSVKVDVSTKVDGTRSIIIRDNGDVMVRFENKADSTLSGSTAQELVSLADSLFVEKTHEIVLSKVDASGRTDYPIFKVTLYKGDTGEITRYDMGTQEGNITHCTRYDIHYSPEFRHFTSRVFEILGY
ncbi:MAG: hypothetical protein HDS52_10715 [Barnesiella sp.]|nr:hypothetical protein [Barnesiella sp.]